MANGDQFTIAAVTAECIVEWLQPAFQCR